MILALTGIFNQPLQKVVISHLRLELYCTCFLPRHMRGQPVALEYDEFTFLPANLCISGGFKCLSGQCQIIPVRGWHIFLTPKHHPSKQLPGSTLTYCTCRRYAPASRCIRDYQLCQGGYVFISVCTSVCLLSTCEQD